MRNRKNVIMIVMIAVALLMATGYAFFASRLNINATGSISSTWNVYFEKIEIGEKVGNADKSIDPSVMGTTATMGANLELPGDSITYKLILKNGGSVPAVIESIEAKAEGSTAIIFKVDGIKKGDKLAGNTSKEVFVTIEYDEVTSQPKETSKLLTVTVNAVQDTGQKVDEEDIFIEGQDNLLVTKILGENKSNVVSSGDGLYVSTATNDGQPTYYYKGNVENNYVKFGKQSVEGHCKIKDEYADRFGDVDLNNCSQEQLDPMVGAAYAVICDYGDSVALDTVMGCAESGGTQYNALEWSEEESLVWRVVRINEDGTVKLILENIINNTVYRFNPNYYNYKYMYYSESDVTDGMKNRVDTWYTNILEENYDSYIATTSFCEAAKVKYGNSFTSGNATMELSSSYTPNFKCELDGNGKQYVNEKAGLITADEVAMVGIPLYTGSQTNNTNTYLQIGYDWWTMSPLGLYKNPAAHIWFVNSNGYVDHSFGQVYNYRGVRPVISLNSNITVEVSNGNGVHGSSTNPYVIKTN